MDDFSGWIPFTALLRLADRYPYRVEVKGGVRNFVSHAIIITSNKRPEAWYDNEKHVMQALFRRITLFVSLDENPELSYVQKGYP